MTRQRLRRLEHWLQTSEPCSACGGGNEPYEVEVRFHDDDAPALPEWCPVCGRQTTVVVTWGDDPYEPRQVRPA